MSLPAEALAARASREILHVDCAAPARRWEEKIDSDVGIKRGIDAETAVGTLALPRDVTWDGTPRVTWSGRALEGRLMVHKA